MTSPRPWTPEDDATLRRLHGEGVALHSSAKQMGRAKQTVSSHAEALGLSFDREGTAAATRAAVTDAKARRTALGMAMLADLEEARKRIGASESAREFQAAAQGMDALMRSYVALLRTEPDDGGFGEAQGIVGKILAAITLSVDGLPRLNPSAPREEVTAK
jgi:hypothetical protein